MGLTPESLSKHLYYSKLPKVYIEEDRKLGEPLKRYLESLIEGGSGGAISDINNLILLVDPKSVPEKFFPYLCRSFGLEYFPDIDVTYQRRFLLNIGELIKRRGTYSSVHFLIRALTGLDASLSLIDKTTLGIELLAKNFKEMEDIELSMRVISNYIQTQIPYYMVPVLSSRIKSQIVESKSYSHSAVGYYKFYKINSSKEGN